MLRKKFFNTEAYEQELQLIFTM